MPALCRRLGADALLGVTPATTMAPLPCPRVIIALDIRHELRPQQFSLRRRLLRRISYGIGYRQADAIVCISQRTHDDLLAAHPFLRSRRVTVAQLGADHVLTWPPRRPGPEYALAFGQWGNKNVDVVLDAWAILRSRSEATPLVVVGLPAEGQAAVEAGAAARGIGDLVTVRPWLSPLEFQQQFTSASLVVLPSDFEGFGLPAVEAMRLGIPVVVTPDPALLEVTGGLATVMDGWDAASLARAVPQARQTSDQDLEAGVEHAATFTWQRTATNVREALVDTASGRDSAIRSQPRRRAKTTSAIHMGVGRWRSSCATPRRRRGQGLQYCSSPVRRARASSKSPSNRRERSRRVFIL